MKLTELMIGDWVICNDLKKQVAAIGETVGFLDCNNQVYWAYEGFDRIDPIPLTEDILVKNGFVKDGNGDYEINDGIVIVMDWKGKSEHFACAPYEVENCFGQYHYLYVELFECKYVHQLQHLLRLVGVQKEIELCTN